MYAPRPTTRGDGLGFAVSWGDLFTKVILPVGATVGGALATRYIARPSTPSAKEIEGQIKLQQQFEIEKMMLQQQQTSQLGSYALPALGVLALVMLLR